MNQLLRLSLDDNPFNEETCSKIKIEGSFGVLQEKDGNTMINVHSEKYVGWIELGC